MLWTRAVIGAHRAVPLRAGSGLDREDSARASVLRPTLGRTAGKGLELYSTVLELMRAAARMCDRPGLLARYR